MESALPNPLHPLRVEMTSLGRGNLEEAPRDALWSLMVGQPTMQRFPSRCLSMFCPLLTNRKGSVLDRHVAKLFSAHEITESERPSP